MEEVLRDAAISLVVGLVVLIIGHIIKGETSAVRRGFQVLISLALTLAVGWIVYSAVTIGPFIVQVDREVRSHPFISMSVLGFLLVAAGLGPLLLGTVVKLFDGEIMVKKKRIEVLVFLAGVFLFGAGGIIVSQQFLTSFDLATVGRGRLLRLASIVAIACGIGISVVKSNQKEGRDQSQPQ